MTGHYVKLEDTIDSFSGLLMGNYDQIPEMACIYMVGGISTVLEKAKMAEDAADLDRQRRARAQQ